MIPYPRPRYYTIPTETADGAAKTTRPTLTHAEKKLGSFTRKLHALWLGRFSEPHLKHRRWVVEKCRSYCCGYHLCKLLRRSKISTKPGYKLLDRLSPSRTSSFGLCIVLVLLRSFGLRSRREGRIGLLEDRKVSIRFRLVISPC